MAMESYRHVEHACFVYFEKSQKMKALELKNDFSFPSFADTAFIFEIFENGHIICKNWLKNEQAR